MIRSPFLLKFDYKASNVCTDTVGHKERRKPVGSWTSGGRENLSKDIIRWEKIEVKKHQERGIKFPDILLKIQ